MTVLDVAVTPDSDTQITVTVPSGFFAGPITLQAIGAPAGDSNTLPWTFQIFREGASVVNGDGALSGELQIVHNVTSKSSGVGTLAGEVAKRWVGFSVAQGEGTLAGEVQKAHIGDSSVQGGGTLDGEIKALVFSHQGESTVSGVGTLAGEIERAHTAESATHGKGTLEGAVSTTVEGTTVVDGGGALDGELRRTISVGSAVKGGGTLAGDLSVNRLGQSVVSGGGTLEGHLDRDKSGASVASGGGTLFGELRLSSLLEQSTGTRMGLWTVSTAYYEDIDIPAVGGTFIKGRGTLAGEISRILTAQSSVNGGGTLQGTLVVGSESGASVVQGGGNLSGTLVRSLLGASVATGRGLLSAAIAREYQVTSSVRGGGTLQGEISAPVQSGESIVAGGGLLSGEVQRTLQVRSAVSGGGTLSGAIVGGGAVNDDFFEVQKRGNAAMPGVVQDVLANDISVTSIAGVRNFVNCTATTDGLTVTVTVPENYVGPASYIYDAIGPGIAAPGNVSMDVVNSPPEVTPIADKVAILQTEFVQQVIATDINGDSLTYSLSNHPPGMRIDNSGRIEWTVEGDAGDLYNITISVSDGTLEVDEVFSLTVTSRWIEQTPHVPDIWTPEEELPPTEWVPEEEIS